MVVPNFSYLHNIILIIYIIIGVPQLWPQNHREVYFDLYTNECTEVPLQNPRRLNVAISQCREEYHPLLWVCIDLVMQCVFHNALYICVIHNHKGIQVHYTHM